VFDLLNLSGTPKSTIVVQTRAGSNVDNEQALPPDDVKVRAYARLVAKHPRWMPRTPPVGTYNCAGHVWASRRTAIYEQSAYDLILKEDGYRLLGASENAQAGDLVLYHRGLNNILHVGLVLEFRRLATGGAADIGESGTPWILSKWSDWSGEVTHHFRDVPESYGTYELSYVTDRP
jgi:hypothetical protein